MNQQIGHNGFDNILIIKLKHLGDVLTTTPLVSAIREAWPRARISYLINPGGEELVRYHPDIDSVLTLPRGESVLGQLAFIRELRKHRFDLVLELSGGDRGAFLARASGASVRVGYRPGGRWPVDRRLLLTHRVTTPVSSKHTVEYHLDALRILGLSPGFRPMSLHWPAESMKKVRAILEERGLGPGGYAVVHPSSRWMFKAWSHAGNAAVIDYIVRDLVLPVVLTSGPDKKEMDYVRVITGRINADILDLSGRLSLAELAALISGAVFFFGVDSLPMHMAAALEHPGRGPFRTVRGTHVGTLGPGPPGDSQGLGLPALRAGTVATDPRSAAV